MWQKKKTTKVPKRSKLAKTGLIGQPNPSALADQGGIRLCALLLAGIRRQAITDGLAWAYRQPVRIGVSCWQFNLGNPIWSDYE
jgi:hypothetical protein